MNKPGRPSFKVLPDRLRHLRESTNFTQKAIANEVYRRLEKTESDPRTYETSYQRIERTGSTSHKFALQLCQVLGAKLGQDPAKVLALLQGATPDAPPDRKEEINARIKALVARGGIHSIYELLGCKAWLSPRHDQNTVLFSRSQGR